jgi:hypothetical protein
MTRARRPSSLVRTRTLAVAVALVVVVLLSLCTVRCTAQGHDAAVPNWHPHKSHDNNGDSGSGGGDGGSVDGPAPRDDDASSASSSGDDAAAAAAVPVEAAPSETTESPMDETTPSSAPAASPPEPPSSRGDSGAPLKWADHELYRLGRGCRTPLPGDVTRLVTWTWTILAWVSSTEPCFFTTAKRT